MGVCTPVFNWITQSQWLMVDFLQHFWREENASSEWIHAIFTFVILHHLLAINSLFAVFYENGNEKTLKLYF